ncbi:MAG: hypothetical protein LBE74_07380 [Treponema sp.]|jgi:hypothetical protein|nr:hypothetical protein [Treponema sp.]
MCRKLSVLYNRHVLLKGFLKIGTCLFLAACATEEVKTPILPWTPPERQVIVQNAFLSDVLDYKDSSWKGIPAWAAAYFNGDDIEDLPQYRDKYLFVSKQTGGDLNILDQFSIEKDFPLLIANRVQKRFTHNLNTYPDAVYGAFFEEAVKAFYDAKFQGVLKEDDFWMRRRETREDRTEGETIDFLTLASADRRFLVSQINAVLSSVKPSEEITRDQATAVMRVKNNFFSDF